LGWKEREIRRSVCFRGGSASTSTSSLVFVGLVSAWGETLAVSRTLAAFREVDITDCRRHFAVLVSGVVFWQFFCEVELRLGKRVHLHGVVRDLAVVEHCLNLHTQDLRRRSIARLTNFLAKSRGGHQGSTLPSTEVAAQRRKRRAHEAHPCIHISTREPDLVAKGADLILVHLDGNTLQRELALGCRRRHRFARPKRL
jgi:hypothetical protein